MKINRASIVVLSMVTGFTLSQSTMASASAADTPVPISFTQTSATIEYGQAWGFELVTDYYFNIVIYGPDANYEVASTSTPSGYKPVLYPYMSDGNWRASLFAPYEVDPLGAGTYTFTVSGERGEPGDRFYAETPTPATLIVEKAKLGMELRVIADPTNPQGAIVSTKFTGRFVDEYYSSYFPGAPISPAGIWSITITDSAGEVATERSIQRTAGDDDLATSFYWTDAVPGEQYTASASFSPEGASAANFSITPATNFSYTGAESARPQPTSTATAKPDASLPEASGFGLPLWAIILVGVLIAGLGALVTILSVRLSRRSTATTEDEA